MVKVLSVAFVLLLAGCAKHTSESDVGNEYAKKEYVEKEYAEKNMKKNHNERIRNENEYSGSEEDRYYEEKSQTAMNAARYNRKLQNRGGKR